MLAINNSKKVSQSKYSGGIGCAACTSSSNYNKGMGALDDQFAGLFGSDAGGYGNTDFNGNASSFQSMLDSLYMGGSSPSGSYDGTSLISMSNPTGVNVSSSSYPSLGTSASTSNTGGKSIWDSILPGIFKTTESIAQANLSPQMVRYTGPNGVTYSAPANSGANTGVNPFTSLPLTSGSMGSMLPLLLVAGGGILLISMLGKH